MAHKKAGGSTRNGRDSESKRLGVKRFGGESVLAGNILVRQSKINYLPLYSLIFIILEIHFSFPINKACLTRQNNYINRRCICIILFNEALITCLEKYCTIFILGDFFLLM